VVASGGTQESYHKRATTRVRPYRYLAGEVLFMVDDWLPVEKFWNFWNDNGSDKEKVK